MKTGLKEKAFWKCKVQEMRIKRQEVVDTLTNRGHIAPAETAF